MTSHNPPDIWQYRIEKHKDNGIILTLGDGLRKIEIRDSENNTCGYILGFPISKKEKKIMTGIYNSKYSIINNMDDLIKQIFLDTAGKFLLIINFGEIARVYPDAAAQIPCVYDKNAHIAASTAHAFLNDEEYENRLDNAILRQFSIYKKGWLPAGMTAHSGVERLLPNHYLDLSSWKVVRFWPNNAFDIIFPSSNTYDEMREIILNQEEAILSSGKNIYQGLTAGVDSRLVLGATLKIAKQIKYVTIVDMENISVDYAISKKISENLDLNHLKINTIISEPEERNLFIHRGGHCIAETNSYIHKSLSSIPTGSVYVSGVGGEVARCYYYKNRIIKNNNLTAKKILLYAEIPETAESILAIDRWLDGIPDFINQYQTLDLFYIENRLGAWASPQFCCDPTVERVSPIICRRMFDIFLSIDTSSKRGDYFVRSAIKYYNLEIGKMRYNSVSGLSGILGKFVKAAREPEKIKNKIKKLLS